MVFYESPSHNPYENLALEEYLFNILPKGEKALLLWQNHKTVVVGKNQNTAEELNSEYIEKEGIFVARRLSGGGAVYHDLGNLNYTLIVEKEAFAAFNFSLFVEPVIKTLEKFGIKASFTGRNDITIEDKKICGNAQYAKDGKILHHGCILLDSELSKLGLALKVKEAKFSSKGVKSVVSRVTTIAQHAPQSITMEDFKTALKTEILKDEMDVFSPSKKDEEAIKKLATEKYATWAWNYGASPKYTMKKEMKFSWGLVTVHLDVAEGNIKKIAIKGDFFGKEDITILEKLLEGKALDASLLTYLESLEIGKYLEGATGADLCEILTY